MALTIRLSSSDIELSSCAHMMANSPPWNILYFTERQCKQCLASPTMVLHIAELDRQLVGFIATNKTGIEGEPLLEYMCVDYSCRGRGIGSHMLEFVERELYPSADNIYLFVSDINPRAMALYERVGYTRVGELPNYNLFGQTEYLYRKSRSPRQEKFRPAKSTIDSIEAIQDIQRKASLTDQQNEGVAKGALDLATGYARSPLPSTLSQLALDGTRDALQKLTAEENVWHELCESVGNILGISPSIRKYIRSTFSGSIALNRVFTAVRDYARKAGKYGLTAIIPEPIIDLSYLLLNEHNDLHIVGTGTGATSSSERIDCLIKQIEIELNNSSHRQILVVLDSPSNPHGFVTSKEDIERLAVKCEQGGAILVVDHCFLLAGIHMPSSLPSIFSLPTNKTCNWIGIWDTGKTIDLSGDKIAFIVPGSFRMANIVNDSLSVIHPDFHSARRSIEVFRRLIGSSEFPSYLNSAGETCRDNLKYIQACLGSAWSIPTPMAGTCACLYHKNSSISSDNLREECLKVGVSVAASRTFYSSTPAMLKEPAPFVRISLFRDSMYFQSAIKRLSKVTLEGER